MSYDRTPSALVQAGLFLPSFAKNGYFALLVRPVVGPEQTTLMTYKSFGPKPVSADAGQYGGKLSL